MFSQTWYGHTYGCDCTNICGWRMEYWECNKLHVGLSCDYNRTISGCREFGSHGPIDMASHGGKTICGRRDGTPFANVTRANENNKCPDGYNRCSDATSAENTICYPKSQTNYVCPITDLRFVLTSSVPSYNTGADGKVKDTYKSVEFNSTTSLIYSTKVGDNLPISSQRLDYATCMDPD